MLEGQRSYIDRVLQGPQREQCIPGTQAGQVSPTHPLLTYSQKHLFLNFLVDSFFFFFNSDCFVIYQEDSLCT